MLIKVSDYIASFFKSKNLKNIFAVSGEASIHLIDSAAALKGMKYYCPIYEQSCAMAADSYSRVCTSTGVVFTSSGPGATNLATGICGAYFDSIPVFIDIPDNIQREIIDTKKVKKFSVNSFKKKNIIVKLLQYYYVMDT